MSHEDAAADRAGRKTGGGFKHERETTMNRTGDEMRHAANEAAHKGGEAVRRTSEEGMRTTRGVETLSKASSLMMQGMQEVSREWMGMTQDNLRRGTDMLQQMSQVKSLPDMLDAQADLMRESLERMIESARRIGEISVRTATEASDAVSKAAEEGEGGRTAA